MTHTISFSETHIKISRTETIIVRTCEHVDETWVTDHWTWDGTVKSPIPTQDDVCADVIESIAQHARIVKRIMEHS